MINNFDNFRHAQEDEIDNLGALGFCIHAISQVDKTVINTDRNNCPWCGANPGEPHIAYSAGEEYDE
jgi:hypothetical protein